MFEAILSLVWDSVPSHCFLRPTKELVGEHMCLVRVTSKVRHEGRLHHLVEASGRNSRKVADILAAPGRTPAPAMRGASFLFSVETPACPLYDVLSSIPCFLIKETVQRRYLQWDIIAESASAVDDLVRKLKKRGVAVKVVQMEKINGGRRLTERQEQILRQAYDDGFFESPHRVGVRELAEVLNCSPSTMVRILRKAEKKVIADKLGLR